MRPRQRPERGHGCLCQNGPMGPRIAHHGYTRLKTMLGDSVGRGEDQPSLGLFLFCVIDVTVILTCDFLGFFPLNSLSFCSVLILATDDELKNTIRNIWQKIVLLYSTVRLHSVIHSLLKFTTCTCDDS